MHNVSSGPLPCLDINQVHLDAEIDILSLDEPNDGENCGTPGEPFDGACISGIGRGHSEMEVVFHENSDHDVDVVGIEESDQECSAATSAISAQRLISSPLATHSSTVLLGCSEVKTGSEVDTGGSKLLKRRGSNESRNFVTPSGQRTKRRMVMSVEIPIRSSPGSGLTRRARVRSTEGITQVRIGRNRLATSSSYIAELTASYLPNEAPVMEPSIVPLHLSSPSNHPTHTDISLNVRTKLPSPIPFASFKQHNAKCTDSSSNETLGSDHATTSKLRSPQPLHVSSLPRNHDIQDPTEVIDISDQSDGEDESKMAIEEKTPEEAVCSEILGPTVEAYNSESVRNAMTSDESPDWVRCSTSLPDERLAPLRNCIAGWAIGYDWEDNSASNPFWTLANDKLMGLEVMDSTVSYLAYQAMLTSKVHSKLVCVIPPSVYGSFISERDWSQGLQSWLKNSGPDGPTRLFTMRDMVWMGFQPPARVILPIIDPSHTHCYLWYGDVKQRQDESTYDCQLYYLDSLPKPSSNLMEQRLTRARMVLQYVLPQINGNVTGVHHYIKAYQQARGSLDCGYFVCQATSALVCYEEKALEAPIKVALVCARVKLILQECFNKALVRLSQRYLHARPIALHRDTRVSPPPWQKRPDTSPHSPPSAKRERSAWVPPEYHRSLSEPLGDSSPENSKVDGWEAVYGPATMTHFSTNTFGNAKMFTEQLQNGGSSPPPGLLADVVTRLPGSLLKAILLEDDYRPIRWLPGIHVVGGEREEELEKPEDCLGVARMGLALGYLRPGRERSLAVLTGENRGQPLRLNWAAETLHINEEWLSASLDIDSLSLTTSDPQFTIPATLHAYPPRSTTLTTDNGLSITVNGVKRPLSHFPNFTLLNLGLNNQFRGNLFFPNYDKGKDEGGRFITMLSKEDFTEWWEEAMLQSISRIAAICPPEFRSSCIRLYQELPKTYAAAEALAVSGSRSFSGFKVTPELLNPILGMARKIVDRTPRLAKYRNFFFHIFGINLKAVAEAIPARLGGDTILHVLQLYPIVDWSAQNPHDIVFDVGLEINVQRDRLPQDVQDLTLLWKLQPLEGLMRSWCQPTVNAYAHSHVVGGLSAKPRAHIAGMFFRIHAYMKDKTVTYIHRDNSHGTGFSPMDGLSGSKTYIDQTAKCLQAWSHGKGSYGCRVEFRCGPWAAGEMLKFEPDLWTRRFLGCEAIVALPTFSVVRLKTIMMNSYQWFFENMQRLPQLDRRTEGVLLLASALTYMIHGLVKRPDDMSSSRSMAKDLQLVSRAIRYGFVSILATRLGPDLCRMDGHVSIGKYPILKYVNRKNPAGARLKTGLRRWGSNSCDTNNTSKAAEPQGEAVWTEEDKAWVEGLVNDRLARWLWTRLPEHDRAEKGRPEAYRGPLLLRNWQTVVGPGVQYAVRKHQSGFEKVAMMLFPPNWIFTPGDRQWESLAPAVLESIQEHIEDAPSHMQAEYSRRMRDAIHNVLETWEFLPGCQKRRVWGYEGAGRTKTYMVHRNPQFRC
ncbi:hypothetical protein FS749_000904 [Ceratobasidium sp. UAMH 11750]|nr:hypothetical protein FS749_000904 [Ceratobasidium sp. UAMH 11750]